MRRQHLIDHAFLTDEARQLGQHRHLDHLCALRLGESPPRHTLGRFFTVDSDKLSSVEKQQAALEDSVYFIDRLLGDLG